MVGEEEYCCVQHQSVDIIMGHPHTFRNIKNSGETGGGRKAED